MLRSLAIRDFVIVDRMDLEFGLGFTVLTGETGAGKSILIDALAMVLGERSDAGVVRPGAERAEIGAEFDLADTPDLDAWLAANELAGDSGTCLLRRLIDAGGRSRAYVNGRSCTLAQLRQVGAFLVDIYGQHEHQSLLRPAAQRALLDGYGGLDARVAEVGKRYRQWREVVAQLRAVEQGAARLERERDEVAFRVRELEALQPAEGEWEALQEQQMRLAHAASLLETAQMGIDVLAEGDAACLPQLAAINARLARAVDHDPRLREVADLLESAQNELQEAAHALRNYGSRIDLDPATLAEVDRRLEAIHDAARKYRVAPEALPGLLLQSRIQFDALAAGLDVVAMRRDEALAREAYQSAANELSQQRQRCAPSLSAKVTAALQTLAMAEGRFEVVLTALEEGGAQGLEEIEFRVASHADLPLRALARVASGGELSRISLAIQTATSEVTRVPTLVFDEVDTGIGGGVAEIVGHLLRNLGRKHQVMCVTHLPQVAASGDAHWLVVKSGSGAGVASEVAVLQNASRVDEVARMLGGVEITPLTRQHAQEMLALAAQAHSTPKRKGKAAGT